MVKLQTSFLGPRLLVIAALAVAAWAMVFKTGVATSDEAGIVMRLPDQVGPWRGEELLFCSRRQCNASFMARQLQDRTTCPQCGAPLSNMTWGERDMLPSDTQLVRKHYTLSVADEGLHASIVLSGNDRSSIHRPQVCMTAAGHEIARERVIRIPLEGRDEPLEVMVLDMVKPLARADGAPAAYTSYYAYWFVGKDRETASHLARMAWMGYDRVFRGVSHRWAYIALAGARDPASDAHLQILANFASQLHPALLKPE